MKNIEVSNVELMVEAQKIINKTTNSSIKEIGKFIAESMADVQNMLWLNITIAKPLGDKIMEYKNAPDLNEELLAQAIHVMEYITDIDSSNIELTTENTYVVSDADDVNIEDLVDFYITESKEISVRVQMRTVLLLLEYRNSKDEEFLKFMDTYFPTVGEEINIHKDVLDKSSDVLEKGEIEDLIPLMEDIVNKASTVFFETKNNESVETVSDSGPDGLTEEAAKDLKEALHEAAKQVEERVIDVVKPKSTGGGSSSSTNSFAKEVGYYAVGVVGGIALGYALYKGIEYLTRESDDIIIIDDIIDGVKETVCVDTVSPDEVLLMLEDLEDQY